MSDRIRAAIESLLRGNWRIPLGPGHARNPVLGALTIVEPSGQPGGGQTLILPPSAWRQSLRIEPGLLCLPPARADIVYPVELVRPGWLATWAGGTGAPVPDADPARSTLLLGELKASADLVPPYDWPDGVDYQGLLYSSAATLQRVLDTSVAATRVRYPATAYTGWAQLWVEACLASGRLLSDRVPPGCTTAPGALGLIWSATDAETGVPTAWAIDVDSVGLWAWEMECSDLTLPTLVALAAGDYTGDAAHLAWLYVLADLKPVGGSAAEPQVVLSGDGIAAAYAHGGPLFMSGWHWHSYSAGGLPVAASVHGADYHPGQSDAGYSSYEVSLEVVPAHAGGTCTATVSADAPAVFRPEWGYDWILVGDPSNLAPVRGALIYPGQDGCAASAPMWGLWTEGGDWEVWRYYSPSYTGGTEASSPWVPTCALSNSSIEHTSGIEIRAGGAGRSAPATARIGTGVTTTHQADIAVTEFNSWHSVTSMWLYGVVTLDNWCGCDWSTSTPAPPMPPAPYVDKGESSPQTRENGGVATGTVKTETLTQGGVVTVTIYDPSQPSAVWQRRSETASALSTRTVVTNKWVGHEQQRRRNRLGFYGYTTPPWIDVPGEPCGGQMKHPWSSGSSVNGITGGGSTVVSDTTTSVSGTLAQSATLYLAGEAITGDAGAAGWASAAQGGTGPWQAAVAAIQSARASHIYRAEPGGVWQSNSGIGAGDAAAAHSWAGG